MTKEDIQHLGTLARIKLTDAEVIKLNDEIEAIVQYVGTVNDIVADANITKIVGARYNIFREDVVTNEPGACTTDMLAAMPKVEGQHLVVKKILNQDT